MSLSNLALPGTALAVTNLVDFQSRLYYQDDFNYIREVQGTNGDWSIDDSPIIKAAFNTPLAAVSFQGGDEVRKIPSYQDQSLTYFHRSVSFTWTRTTLSGKLPTLLACLLGLIPRAWTR